MATNIIDCYAKLPSGKTIALNLVPNDTINSACRKVAEKEEIPPDRVNLKYQGKVLQKHHTVGYLGVCKETILKAEITQVKKLNIFVKLESGKTIPVSIENVSPLRYINDAIHAKEGIPSSKQVLKIAGRKLDKKNQRCIDAGIMEESIITLEVDESKNKVFKSKKRHEGSTGSLRGSDSDDDISKTKSKIKNTEDNTNETVEEDARDTVLGTFDAMGRNVEVAFCFDTTGSMYSCLTQVRSKLKETVKKLIEEIANIRIAIMAQGDYCDYNNYVVKYEDFTNDVDKLVEFVGNVGSTGGGDGPECYEWSLRKAQQLDWSEDSAKAFVLIGDDIPHPPSYTDQNINWHEELDVVKAQGIKIYGVRAQHSTNSTTFYQEISEQTGGAYIEFKNFAVITEMFLAVCYKEAGEEQFEQFCEEIEKNEEGTNKQEVQNILKQIDEAESNKKEDKPKRHVAESWWDFTLDKNTTPQYVYNANTDEWRSFQSASGTINRPLSASDSVVMRSPGGCVHGHPGDAPITRPVTLGLDHTDWKNLASRKSKKGCVLM